MWPFYRKNDKALEQLETAAKGVKMEIKDAIRDLTYAAAEQRAAAGQLQEIAASRMPGERV